MSRETRRAWAYKVRRGGEAMMRSGWRRCLGISKSTWEKAAAFSNNDDARAAGTKEGEGPRLGRRGTRGHDWRSKRRPAGVRTQVQMQWKTSVNYVESGSAGIQDEMGSEPQADGRTCCRVVSSCKWFPASGPLPKCHARDGCDGVVTLPAAGTLQHQLEPESKVQSASPGGEERGRCREKQGVVSGR
ncbi:hypothetical protein BGZ61DRAFT_485398 [Ilyonectria robusta]|uniref:uncharacterized protein n=1 Tax=Ilyonectria robusta TaxID=1079257 RepID=UPI001E8D2382|nr:uncharacterized protein BGZ61DRAFT_485398 [Ilyonectria robusta]KAH8661266.1 hypothetical protein BGZ61DRAFT_485398 [Ilyonectria robusta]